MKPVVVAPFHRPLLQRLRGRSVALETDVAHSAEAVLAAADFGLNLVCLRVRLDDELAALDASGLPPRAPLAVVAPAAGPMRRLGRKVSDLLKLNARFYLPGRTREQAADLRMLASLGLNVAADLVAPGPAEWDELRELAVYAFYNSTPHADLDPFSFLGRRYHLDRLPLDPRSVMFRAPGKFFFADENGGLASPTWDGGTDPCPFTLADLDSEAASSFLDEARVGWRRMFVEPHPCTSCEGFRVCLGLFAAEQGPGCRALMAEALAGAEWAAGQRAAKVEPWQP